MNKITSLLQKYEFSKNKGLQNKILLGLFFLFGVIIALDHAASQSKLPQTPGKQKESPSADTYIPAGFTLVPIEIINSLQISPLIGSIGGKVDLYRVSDAGKKSKLIYSSAKLLRAPLDPDQFAVLIPSDDVLRLLSESTMFFAVVLNPQQNKMKPSQKSTTKHRAIEIEYQENI